MLLASSWSDSLPLQMLLVRKVGKTCAIAAISYCQQLLPVVAANVCCRVLLPMATANGCCQCLLPKAAAKLWPMAAARVAAHACCQWLAK